MTTEVDAVKPEIEQAADETIEPIKLAEERDAELIAELRAYGKQIRSAGIGDDARQIFEGWAIQKLANLQIMMEAMSQHIEDLGKESERRKRKA